MACNMTVLNELYLSMCAVGNVIFLAQALTTGKQILCSGILCMHSWSKFKEILNSLSSDIRRGLCPWPVSHCIIRGTVRGRVSLSGLSSTSKRTICHLSLSLIQKWFNNVADINIFPLNYLKLSGRVESLYDSCYC